MAQLHRRAGASWVVSVLALAGAVACSPGYVSSDGQTDGTGGSDEGTGGADGADGSGGSDGTGGADGSDGSGGSTDGSGGSEPGTGGDDSTGGTANGSGGSDMGTGGFDSSCDQNDTCVAAANFNDECFSPDCSAPVAARQSEVDRDLCLVPWGERTSTIPEECAAANPTGACPGICEIQPPCVGAACHGNGECGIEICVP